MFGLWKWLFGGSLFLCIMLGIALKLERIHSHKLNERVVSLTAELNEISSKKNEQQVVTREKIKVVLQKTREADDQAKKIEQAPLPGECKTPKEILDADI
jgi:hypothetical protein